MKKYKFDKENLSVVTTKYAAPKISEIMELIYKKSRDYVKEFGDDPKGVVLGPNEYLAFLEVVRADTSPGGAYNYECRFGYPEKVFGLPITLKRSNGIDLSIDFSLVFRFAKGVVE